MLNEVRHLFIVLFLFVAVACDPMNKPITKILSDSDLEKIEESANGFTELYNSLRNDTPIDTMEDNSEYDDVTYAQYWEVASSVNTLLTNSQENFDKEYRSKYSDKVASLVQKSKISVTDYLRITCYAGKFGKHMTLYNDYGTTDAYDCAALGHTLS